jgi:hypothetical protein
MALVTFFVKKHVSLNTSDSAAILTNDQLLRETRMYFRLNYLNITDDVFKQGRSGVDIHLQIAVQGMPQLLINKSFRYHGPFQANQGHLFNQRYIAADGEHFCTTWSRSEKRFTELMHINFAAGEINRFIPVNSSLWT